MKAKSIEELNVLIAEDDRHMRMPIRSVVFALGVHDAAEAPDGKTAVLSIRVPLKSASAPDPGLKSRAIPDPA